VKPPSWQQRIKRADELIQTYPFAAEILQFYKKLAPLQENLYLYCQDGLRPSQHLSNLDVHFDRLLPKFQQFLSDLASIAPASTTKSARDLNSQSHDEQRRLLTSFVKSPQNPDHADSFMAWLFLQPFAECFAERGQPTESAIIADCPFCSHKPLVGVLRPEGDGGKRSLICSLCATEWACGRLICPACGEENVEKLAVYTADKITHVRVEACDSCHHYIKTVDLTKNGHAIPVVDELATIPLNLWAHDHGYVKLCPNLLGI
jgi:FdhE protein